MTLQLDIGDGRSMAYTQSGQGSALVIIHGVGGHKEDWAEVARELSAIYRVFCIDMLGFGDSAKDDSDFSMSVQSLAVLSLLEKYGIEKTSLLGNSVGGWVAATFAATYPERVNKLMLMDVAGFKAMFEGEPPVNFDPNSVEEMQALISYVINSDFARQRAVAEKAYASYIASGEKAIAGVWGQSLFRSERLEELLPRISAPTVFAWGADDRLFPAVLADVFCKMVPNATTSIIPKAGHFPHIDNPSATLKAVKNFFY
jgi:pimeloyl-ACP methyl ester carboxylesterase